MKKLISILIILFLVSCSPQKDNLDWILGQWQRTNNAVGQKTFEQWSKKSKYIYIGLGFTLKGQDTVFKENMRILKMDGVWNLEVRNVNEYPTYFKFIKQSETSFVCENPDNKFPKKIKYFKDEKKLTAIISDENTEIPFYFK